ncbi:HAD-superfamily hydrolase, subfamily IIB [Sphaerochaeta pleomorpha str. Grapes]|uniref:HAD-superfamily hydrolase, subfamily IIB n=1 Tax=Sphaerochaeta pleomorpha (strain ATCC BAA-1885 / DSM 22778 / Grapes) TaxID=158190 RepID=G8QR36_SPHPG|nr:HAD-IIB family hydrolase [Sphaerochaeta pleomorpha]AEV29884.1 HAD-superfamily hydrolase, subfamily IIB [Sphaerochaeta pleomorpha str. Grapes]
MDNSVFSQGSATLRDLSFLSPSEVGPLEYVLTDVDDTITTNGKLRPEALQALYDLSENGFKVICVTGGSAGWGDTYLRQWPIEAVLSESGAVCLYRERKVIKRYVHPSIVQQGYQERCRKLIEAVLAEVPGSKLSSDQFARLYDIAFDHGSEPPYLDKDQIEAVVAVCRRHGAATAVSSIHVNAWFGQYDKREGTISFFKDILGIDAETLKKVCCYCGDAPNDQVMFSYIPLSFGVGNVLDHKAEITEFPVYVSHYHGGKGFSQIAAALIAAKNE